MKILYYTGFFSEPLASAEGFDPALVANSCEIWTDRARLPDADAVVFHLPNLLSEKLPDKRIGQVWIGLSVEAASNYPLQADAEFMRKFDVHMLLRRDCEIPLSYFRPQTLPSFRSAPKWKWRRTPAVYFGSNLASRNGRTTLLEELAYRMPVHVYGKGPEARRIRHDRGRETKIQIIARYPFYFAFENCNEKDYVSEKIYDAFVAGTVPVYFGAPNVRDFLPAEKCVILVSDFANAQELAEYLLDVGGSRHRYAEYLAWRREPFSEAFMQVVEQSSTPSLVRLHRKLVEIRAGSQTGQLVSLRS